MKINGYKKEFIKVVTFRVEDVPDIGTVIYSTHYNDFDKVIDTVIRTEDGYDIDVPAVLEEVENFIDQEMRGKMVFNQI